jgi:hypothetical protein
MTARRAVSALLVLPLCASAFAAGRDASATRVTTERRDGVLLQKSETIPHRNVLPPAGERAERELARTIPPSGRISSLIRWTSSDGAAIGQDLAVSPSGANTFVGWNLNNLRVSFHDNANATPLWEYQSSPQTYRNFVDLSTNASTILNGSGTNLYRFNKSNGTVLSNFVPEGGRTAGPVATSRDDSLFVCAASSPVAGGTHRLYAFRPGSPSPFWTFDFSDNQSSGIYGVAISIDRTLVAVNGKFYGWILNASNGSVRAAIPIDNTESRIAMSRDGSVVAIAENSGFLKVYTWIAPQSRYNLLWQYKIPAGSFTNWASSVALSADGATLMAGSLIFLTGGYDGSVYMFETFGEGVPKWVYAGAGDMVDEVVLSDDGSIGAAVTWGDLAQTKDDILIFERESNVPVFGVNTPGSMFALGMSADGRTVAAGGKAVHAREFGSGGIVHNIAVDLGGGTVSGRVTLTGAPDNGGAVAQVAGTNRKGVSAPDGRYVIPNVPAGTWTVRVSALGFVGTSIGGVTVANNDTARNVNATLAAAGPPPGGLTASSGLDSRIVLAWTNPSGAEDRMLERILAADDVPSRTSVSARSPVELASLPAPAQPEVLLVPDSVRVYRGTRSGGPYFLRTTLPGTLSSFVDSAVLPLRTYYYRTTALTGGGESRYSNEASGSVDSAFLKFSFTAPHRATLPVIDGVLSPGEWADAERVDVSDVFGNGGGIRLPRGTVFMYVKYDSTAKRLYLAGEDRLNTDGLAAGEGFGIYVDDNNNDQFEAQGTNPLLREGNYWAYWFSAGPTVRFREIYTNGGVNAVVDTVRDAQTAMSSAAGYFTGEVSIPLGFFDRNHLQVYAPGRTVGAGVFIIGRDAGGAAVFHGWWPQTMNSVFTARGFGDIRIPIRLLAPPKAPTNVAAARQGDRVRVTWTPPTEGINNDPLTVPVTMELNRNFVAHRQFGQTVTAWTDSATVPEGWYEYKLRGFVSVASAQVDYFGPYSPGVGLFAVRDPQLAEIAYDDGVPEVFYVVDFTYNDNKFAIRFTPGVIPSKVYRVKAYTNNGFKPISISIFSDSGGIPGRRLAGPYPAESFQTAGVDTLLLTFPGSEPPTLLADFHVVLEYLPDSPGAPGIGGDNTAPVDGRSQYYTATSGWMPLPLTDLMVRAIVSGSPSGADDPAEGPAVFALHQNYPNPFNPVTHIRYELPERGRVSLRVYDLLGREVAVLVDGEAEAGRHIAAFDGGGRASGVYFYRLTAGGFTETRAMVLTR